ncbi:Uncharacterized protein APZ42_021086 [Daphnia magna]|uniref:Uncharacterized protein n=1 Tax=Daphnia magna TaxID=35525 RepID=A0A164WY02_9CRUS|nr:Uncharacterized protein APZ42_021086 [Daphnia magna]
MSNNNNVLDDYGEAISDVSPPALFSHGRCTSIYFRSHIFYVLDAKEEAAQRDIPWDLSGRLLI